MFWSVKTVLTFAKSLYFAVLESFVVEELNTSNNFIRYILVKLLLLLFFCSFIVELC